MKTPIFGPAYISRSTNFADCQLINLYPEVCETRQGKAIGALYGTPGLDLIATVGAGPIRAMATNGSTMYIVSGTELYTMNTGYAVTDIGPVAAAGGTTCAGYVYTPSAGSLAAITLPYTGTGPATVEIIQIGGATPQIGIFAAVSAAQQDGFGLINQPGTYTWWQTNLLDLTTISALNFAQASGDPDNIVAVRQKTRQVYIFKQYDMEVWSNVGTAGFAFSRLDGVFVEVGLAAPASVAKANESFLWLAQNRQGQRSVGEITGYQAKRVSTFGLEAEFQGYSTVADAIAYAYQQDDHTFYVLTFPTANTTWVYDKTMSELIGAPQWHRRASFSAGVFNRHIGNAFSFFNGKPMIGDYQNGNIYAFNMATLTDNSAAIKRLRTWRALQQPTDNPTRFSSLRIDMQTGINIAAGADPQMMLRYSDDGGHTWSQQYTRAVGQAGQTANRVQFKRLGSTRRNSGLDRIFEISGTDAFPWAIVNAELT